MATRAIGTLGTIDSITVGGRVFTDLTNLIILHAGLSTGGDFSTFRKASGSAGYQVTAGKTLHIYALDAWANATNVQSSIILLYGDTDVGQTSGSGPTNPVYLAGSTTYQIADYNNGTGGGIVYKASALDFPIPSTKYVAYLSGNLSSVVLYGYEV